MQSIHVRNRIFNLEKVVTSDGIILLRATRADKPSVTVVFDMAIKATAMMVALETLAD